VYVGDVIARKVENKKCGKTRNNVKYVRKNVNKMEKQKKSPKHDIYDTKFCFDNRKTYPHMRISDLHSPAIKQTISSTTIPLKS